MKKQKKGSPPKLAMWFFEWYCGEDVVEDFSGDMEEIFVQNLMKMSATRAKLKYWAQMLSLASSYAVRSRRRRKNHLQIRSGNQSVAMLQSYCKIAFRNLAKQKTFSFINAICLSVGMSVGLIALGVLVDVMEVDNFQTKGDHIYRVTTLVDDGNEKITYASSSAPLAEQLKAQVPGVRVVQLAKGFDPEVIQSANTSLPLEGYFASNSFLDVFSFELTEGNPGNALDKPFSVIITESAAHKLFNNGPYLGRTLELNGLGNFEITGLVRDYSRSHLDFEIIASYNTLIALERQGKRAPSLDDWGPRTSYYTYLLLENTKQVAETEKVIRKIKLPLSQTGRLTPEVSLGLQPLHDIPTSDLNNEIGLSWGLTTLMIFFFLSLLVLLPACFNYANISIATALKRAKEIGLRKVSGGQSKHVFLQIVMETMILSLISLAGAMLIFITVRDPFLDMIVKGNRSFDLEITPATFGIFVLFALFTGFIAGVFPASYFSKLNPIQTLRNSSKSGKLSKISIRKGLIVTQFALSMFFILGVAIAAKQYRYALNYDFGFQKENILDIPLKGVNSIAFKTELEKIPEVLDVSMSSSIPGNWTAESVWVKYPQKVDSINVFQMFVDGNYIPNLEIKLIAGNLFPESVNSSRYIIVNETFVHKAGLGSPLDAIGKGFIVDKKPLEVIGVIKDFHFMPLQEEISSFFFRYDPAQFNFANVKLRSDNIQETLSKLEQAWLKITDQKFEARFLDDEVEESLVSYKSMIKIFGFLGALAITISCLGLLAVIISTTESRTREMGIRKVFGASASDLAMNLSKSFLKLIAIAVMIAVPVTYLLFESIFLRMFFYRASIGFVEIAASILILFTLVIVIVGSQTLKVTRINPVDTLKYE